jgi:hypothetical protein
MISTSTKDFSWKKRGTNSPDFYDKRNQNGQILMISSSKKPRIYMEGF